MEYTSLYVEYDSEESDLEFGRDFFHPQTTKIGVMSEIVKEKLYLSDYTVANNIIELAKYDIRGIISLGGLEDFGEYKEHPGIEYCHVWVDDDPTEEIEIHFEDCFDFIDNTKGAVLVHCWVGRSRSATIVIAYLIVRKAMSFKDAWNHVKEQRSFIFPNSGFQAALMKL